MAEPEDVILEAAHFATLAARKIWNRGGRSAPRLALADLRRRLDLLTTMLFPNAPEILAASAKDLNELWLTDLRKDHFSLLDENSRKWVEPAIEELGRRFVISDFESPEPAWRPA